MTNATKALTASALLVLAGCQTASPVTSQTRPIEEALAGGLPPASAKIDPTYRNLTASKAQALSIDSNTAGIRHTNNVANQPNPVAAALRALNDCESARAARATPSTPCEILRKNELVIHSTAELNRGLPDTRPALLWRLSAASKPNAANVYIGGSIHVLKPTLRAPPSYFQALAASDALVFEIDDTELSPTEMQTLVQRYGNLPEGQTLANLMTPDEYTQVTHYVTALGVPEAMIRRMKPAMLLLQVGVLEYISMGYLAEHGVEATFRANKGERDLLALESIEQQLAAATALPLPLQTELLLETIAEADSANVEISNLVRAWLAGDEQQLNQLFNDNSDASPAAQQWMNDLLTKRNIGMAAGITNLLGSNRTYFVLVGAAHLVGRDSVIALLRNQGITATRLRHDALEIALP